MAVWCKLKILSLWITVRHHAASLVMPNSYPRDGIFNPHLTTIKDSYIQKESNQRLHCLLFHLHFGCITVMILSFRTDMPGQTVQTWIRLIRVYTVCHSVRIVWTHYSMVEPHRSNFRVITTNILGVQIFRKFTVMLKPPRSNFRIIKAIFSGVCTFQVITVGSKSHFSPPDWQY